MQMAAVTSSLPASGSNRERIALEGETYETDQDRPLVRSAMATPDLFATFGVDIVRGRDFTLQDGAGAPAVALVNRRFVDTYFAGKDPIGRRFKVGPAEGESEWISIVGIVPDMRMQGFDPDVSEGPGFYRPLAQMDVRFASLAAQVGGGNPLGIAGEVRAAVRTLNADLPIYWVRDMDEVIRQGTWFYNVFGTLFIVFGAAALFMASVGLYGVLAFTVSRRVQEMGIRMALGAKAMDVIRLVMREGAWQMGIGLALGLGLAMAVSNVVSMIMFDVDPRDPVVYGTIVTVIVAVGTVAGLVPAQRAVRVDPIVALRHE